MSDTKKRGFAGMDPVKQREISSRGGKAAHEKGTAHQFSPDEAREAGRKGGKRVSEDREHMARIGRAGGRSQRRRRSEIEDAKPFVPPKERSSGAVSNTTADSTAPDHAPSSDPTKRCA